MLLYGAITQFTTLAAFTQMGSIQERAMPWSTLSRPSTSDAPKQSQQDPVVKKDDSQQRLRNVLWQDKVVYTLGVVNVVFTAYLAGHAPQYFYLFHTPKALVYIGHRWYTFKQENKHYLLYDFCYWANFLSLIYCWILPDSALVFRILFVVSNGPLAWSVLAFSQSLIFHSAPHMTSVFIHTSPMVLTQCIRWHKTAFHACDGNCEDVPAWDLLWDATTKFYGWWVVLYYLWVFVVMGNRVKQRGYQTLFDRVVSRGPTKFLARISKHDLVQKAAYMGTHFVFALFTMSLTVAYWRFYWIHFTFIFVTISVSAWNASGFYFTVFLARYEQEVKERAGIVKEKKTE